MTSTKLAHWFCTAIVIANGNEQARLAEALAKALEPLTDNERMDLYSKLFDVPDCHPAKPERDIGNGNRQIDLTWNYVTKKETLQQ
jgi:hypothetical protein